MESKQKNGLVRLAAIGSAIVAVILVVGTILIGRNAGEDTEKAVRTVSLLYLEELAGRREQVVNSTLEKYINDSLIKLQKLFQKEEILKFLYKYVFEGKINFEEEIKSEEKEVTEEIASKQDNFCRELKKIFDKIQPNIYMKYNNRIASATIEIMKTIYKRWRITTNKIREVKVKIIDDDCEENKKKYEKLEALKSIIQEIIYISSFYMNELTKADTILLQNLDNFYGERQNVNLINVVNGEEIRLNGEETIKKVVDLKEKAGGDFIEQNKAILNHLNEEKNRLDNKLEKMFKEIEDVNKQKIIFEKYCNEGSIFKEINEIDFLS